MSVSKALVSNPSQHSTEVPVTVNNDKGERTSQFRNLHSSGQSVGRRSRSIAGPGAPEMLDWKHQPAGRTLLMQTKQSRNCHSRLRSRSRPSSSVYTAPRIDSRIYPTDPSQAVLNTRYQAKNRSPRAEINWYFSDSEAQFMPLSNIQLLPDQAVSNTVNTTNKTPAVR